MSTLDLSRIPAPYREHALHALAAARDAAIRDTGVRDDRLHLAAADTAARRALAPFLAIAFEADDAADAALEEFEDAEAARAAVWARRMAEHGEHHDCPACTVQTAAMRAAADEQSDPMAAAMMRMTASAWASAEASKPEEDVHPDLARRLAGSIGSRAQVPRHAGPDCPDPCTVINNGQAAQAALDGLTRYLETHVAAMPADLVQRAILALAMTLPAGPLAPTSEPVATLGVIVSLLRTLPLGRMPTVCLGGGADGYRLLAARDGARTFTIAGTDETPPLRCVYVEYDGIEIKARCTRAEVP